MNILHISDRSTQGGAAQAAYRLHKGLIQAGHNSQMMVGWRSHTEAKSTPLKKLQKGTD
jgi:hypothetical protein